MKKLSIFAFAAIFSIFGVSCNNGENKDKEDEKTSESEKETKAQIVDLASFNETYEVLEFETCDEFETAMKHYADIYFTTLDKAVEGDETAIEEFKELHDMKCTFEKQAENLNDDCPDKMSELGEKYEEKIENNKDKIEQIISSEDTDEEVEDKNKNTSDKEAKTDDQELVKRDDGKQNHELKKRNLELKKEDSDSDKDN
ncbi:MAG: hypothetical protein ACOCVX_03905 [Bacteroidales bacterium]